MRRVRLAVFPALGLAAATLSWSLVTVAAQAPPAPASAAPFTGGRSWVGHEKELEDFIKNVEVGKIDDISVGVTHPKRVHLAPGGMVEMIAFKPLKPGIYEGFWESYKAEIAAYEMDKLLDLHMVPPTVEKRVKGDLGAAVMWIAPTKSFKELGGVPNPPADKIETWNKQIVRAKMFDDLIANKDPNLGNWLLDPDWNVVLIDHSRCFTSTKDLTHQLTKVDGEFWDKMKTLTIESLTASPVGQWLKKDEIKGVIERRDKMDKIIEKLPRT